MGDWPDQPLSDEYTVQDGQKRATKARVDGPPPNFNSMV